MDVEKHRIPGEGKDPQKTFPFSEEINRENTEAYLYSFLEALSHGGRKLPDAYLVQKMQCRCDDRSMRTRLKHVRSVFALYMRMPRTVSTDRLLCNVLAAGLRLKDRSDRLAYAARRRPWQTGLAGRAPGTAPCAESSVGPRWQTPTAPGEPST